MVNWGLQGSSVGLESTRTWEGQDQVRLCAFRNAPQKDGARRGGHEPFPKPEPAPRFPSLPTGQTVQVGLSEPRWASSCETGPSSPGGATGFQRDPFRASSKAANIGPFRPHRVSLCWTEIQGHGHRTWVSPEQGPSGFPPGPVGELTGAICVETEKKQKAFSLPRPRRPPQTASLLLFLKVPGRDLPWRATSRSGGRTLCPQKSQHFLRKPVPSSSPPPVDRVCSHGPGVWCPWASASLPTWWTESDKGHYCVRCQNRNMGSRLDKSTV